MQFQEIEKALGGKKALKANIKNRLDIIRLSRRGIAKKSLNHLSNVLHLSMDDVADLLPVSKRTIQRYAQTDYFMYPVSDKILEIASIVSRGQEVFGDIGKFIQWLNQESVPLGNRTPLSLLKYASGVDMVQDELGKIEQGIIS